MSYRSRLSVHLGKLLDGHLDWPTIDVYNGVLINNLSWKEGWVYKFPEYLISRNHKMLTWLASSPGPVLLQLFGVASYVKHKGFIQWFVYHHGFIAFHNDPIIIKYLLDVKCPLCRDNNKWNILSIGLGKFIECTECKASLSSIEYFRIWKKYIAPSLPKFSDVLQSMLLQVHPK